MTDINIDPQEITNAHNVMTDNKDTILADLRALLTAVQHLLTTDGGLWLKTSSPVMSEQFTLFANNLQDAITNIESFAGTFDDILNNLNQLDVAYAKSE